MDEVIQNSFNFDLASWQDLNAEAKRLQSEVDNLSNRLRMTEVALSNRDRQRSEVAEIVERLIDDKIIIDKEDITTLSDALGFEVTREVAFTITVEISGTIELPYGEDLDEYNFDVEGVSYNGYDIDIDHSTVENLDWDDSE